MQAHGVVLDPDAVELGGKFAERADLQQLVSEHVRIGKPAGCTAPLKVPSVVAGMVAGADSIEDMACCDTAGCRGCSL